MLNSLAKFLADLDLNAPSSGHNTALSSSLNDVVVGLILLMSARAGSLRLLFIVLNKLCAAVTATDKNSASEQFSFFTPRALDAFSSLLLGVLAPRPRERLAQYWSRFGVHIFTAFPTESIVNDLLLFAQPGTIMSSANLALGSIRASRKGGSSDTVFVLEAVRDFWLQHDTARDANRGGNSQTVEPVPLSALLDAVSNLSRLLTLICAARAKAVIAQSRQKFQEDEATTSSPSSDCSDGVNKGRPQRSQEAKEQLTTLPDSFLLETLEHGTTDIGLDQICAVMRSTMEFLVRSVGNVGDVGMQASTDQHVQSGVTWTCLARAFDAGFFAIEQLVASRKYNSTQAKQLVDFSNHLIDFFAKNCPEIGGANEASPVTSLPRGTQHNGSHETKPNVADRGQSGFSRQEGFEATIATAQLQVKQSLINFHVLCSSNLFSASEKHSFLVNSYARLNTGEMTALEVEIFQAFLSEFDETQVESIFDLAAHDIIFLWKQLVAFISQFDDKMVATGSATGEIDSSGLEGWKGRDPLADGASIQESLLAVQRVSRKILLRMATIWCLRLHDDVQDNQGQALATPMHVDIVTYVFEAVAGVLDVNHGSTNYAHDGHSFLMGALLPKVVGVLCNLFDSFIDDCNKFPFTATLVKHVPAVLRRVREVLFCQSMCANPTKNASRFEQLLLRLHGLLSILVSLLVRGLLLSVRVTAAEWTFHDILSHPIFQQESDSSPTCYPVDRLVAETPVLDSSAEASLDIQIQWCLRGVICYAHHHCTARAMSNVVQDSVKDERESSSAVPVPDSLFAVRGAVSPSTSSKLLLWQRRETFDRLVETMLISTEDVADSTALSDNDPIPSKCSEIGATGRAHVALQLVRVIVVLKHIGLLAQFVTWMGDGGVKNDALRHEQPDAHQVQTKKLQQIWKLVTESMPSLPDCPLVEAGANWHEEESCTQALTIVDDVVTKSKTSPDYATAFVDFQFPSTGVYNCTLGIERANGGSMYFGVALKSISNRTGFAGNSMRHQCWYLRSQGELRTGSQAFQRTSHCVKTGDRLRIEVFLTVFITFTHCHECRQSCESGVFFGATSFMLFTFHCVRGLPFYALRTSSLAAVVAVGNAKPYRTIHSWLFLDQIR